MSLPPAASLAPLIDPAQNLPHGPGFRFVSRVTRLEAGVAGAGAWDISGTEAFFADHFPGRPVVPGVLMGEALAQLSGIIAFADSPGRQAGIAALDLRFTRPVVPPNTVEMETTVLDRIGPLTRFAVKAQVGGKTVAKGELTLVEAV